MTYPKITIVTPSFNDVKFLERTILSLLDQKYPNLEYIIIDGGSSDGSIDIIKKYESQLKYWVSEKDDGMYAALQKGFDQSTGEIMGWINSDDKHQTGSLFMLAQIFSEYTSIDWVQGTPNIIDANDRIVYAAHRPEIDRYFFYEKNHILSRKYIQQESTFWRRRLWKTAGGYISKDYKYAGDFELWIRFFRYAKLYNIPMLLGSFRLTGEKQSSVDFYKEYVAETLHVLDRFPLNKIELRQLSWLIFKNKLIKKLNKWHHKITKNDQSVINDRIIFESVSQKFKMI